MCCIDLNKTKCDLRCRLRRKIYDKENEILHKNHKRTEKSHEQFGPHSSNVCMHVCMDDRIKVSNWCVSCWTSAHLDGIGTAVIK